MSLWLGGELRPFWAAMVNVSTPPPAILGVADIWHVSLLALFRRPSAALTRPFVLCGDFRKVAEMLDEEEAPNFVSKPREANSVQFLRWTPEMDVHLRGSLISVSLYQQPQFEAILMPRPSGQTWTISSTSIFIIFFSFGQSLIAGAVSSHLGVSRYHLLQCVTYPAQRQIPSPSPPSPSPLPKVLFLLESGGSQVHSAGCKASIGSCEAR